MTRLSSAGPGIIAGAALAILASAALVDSGPDRNFVARIIAATGVSPAFAQTGQSSAPASSANAQAAEQSSAQPPSSQPVPVVAEVAQVLATYPHDPSAFTQGLFFADGKLFESTGHEGTSFVREVDLTTGKVVRQAKLHDRYFGEGSTAWGDKIYSLTWRHGTGFIWDRRTLKQKGTFNYTGEGWGLTQDGKSLIMSDGSDELRFLNPETFQEERRIKVRLQGRAIRNLNELEYVRGEILANVWFQNVIVRIDPADGNIIGFIDLRAVTASIPNRDYDSVLNGIAYDAEKAKLYVTGKNWPMLFEIALPGAK